MGGCNGCGGGVSTTSRTYHRTTRLRQVHKVVYVSTLSEFCSKSDLQALQFHCYDIMRHIALLLEDQELRYCLSFSFVPLRSPQRGPLIDPVHVILCNTARIFTHESNTCTIRRLAFLNLGFIDIMSCTRSLSPSTTSHRRIVLSLGA